MTLSEMKRVLSEEGIRLTRSLGQSFLHDGNQLRRIAEAAGLTASDRVLEIGPGLGPLTELLLAQAGEVLALEKDRRLFEFLKKRFAPHSNLVLLHTDGLAFLQEQPRDWSDWKLVANLPYSVASPILVELAALPQGPSHLIVTLQLEVVRRLVAVAGAADYGLLSLLVQLRYSPGGWFRIPSTCFHPAPEVESACVTLARRPQPLLSLELLPTFRSLVKLAFSQRRKMMLKLLKARWPPELLGRGFEQLGLSPQVRAERVSLEQFVQLARLLGSARAEGEPPRYDASGSPP